MTPEACELDDRVGGELWGQVVGKSTDQLVNRWGMFVYLWNVFVCVSVGGHVIESLGGDSSLQGL